ncbi:mucin-5B, partial [Silurus meridionalis]
CSTWGNFNFKTYDGDFFQLHSTCNYILTSQCSSSYEDFNIQLRRQVINGEPLISKITMKLDGTVVELSKGSISVDGHQVTLPYSHSGVLIEENPTYIKVTAKLGLVAMWNGNDAFMVELDNKYKNQTCGLCGDFNGVQLYNEFIKNGVEISPSDYAQFSKMDAPTESCSESPPPSVDTCMRLTSVCEQLFSGPAFSDCENLVSLDYFIKACESDMCQCSINSTNFCLCSTISEFSRQCVHAGGKPSQWRTEQFCPKACPYPNMVHKECGNPCINTCSNPDRGQVCAEHCIDGCFCPPGLVLDDLTGQGCIAQDHCSCIQNGKIYQTGQNFSSNCKECTCTSNQWSCIQKDCPGTCSVEGGSHITTFDGKTYNFHGDCTYILAEVSAEFVVVGDLVRCGLTTTETCLKAVTLALSAGNTVFNILPDGKVFLNRIYSQLPLSTAGVNVFRPTTFYIVVQTSFGLQLEIQLVPIMQVYITVDVSHKQNLLGLCGNFNDVQSDDFTTMSGSREGTGVGFGNSWRTRASCPEMKNTFENPCSLSVENEKYAQKWCSLLSDPNGVFASCHAEISPDIYQKNCIYDTCNCENSENCMCASLSSYVHACAAKGILLTGWRSEVCMKYATSCPSTMVYTYDIRSSTQSCRCQSDPDFTCSVTFDPVDGCVCAEGTYLSDNGKCVSLDKCSCYYKGSVIPPAEVISKDGIMCTCKNGKLSCIGSTTDEPSCTSPMVFFNCSDATGSTGAECQKSCNTLDMPCISTECVSGCMCPVGLVSDGKGGCIDEALCSCVHNSQIFQPGESIKVDCNTCTCKDRKWQCSTDLCHGTCTVYGDGHYITFDGKRYTFDGDCEYTLVRDHCSHSNTSGTFRVITENIPCGTTGTTCSKAIKLFLGSNELLLTDGGYEVIQRNAGDEIPYQISVKGIYMVIEANNGLILMWDKKTSIFIKLSPDFKGEVCGLCGNYDGNTKNDFTLRNQGVVNNALEFGNSWKESSSCPDASQIKNPCTFNPYRQAWAQKQCSIIMSEIFVTCHTHVDPAPYYSACVRDACACDSGGDCECFCTAVAAYAEACNEGEVCVAWRTPKVCPLFCDYYNPPDECEWHYKPCGSPCMKTCRNPDGTCSSQIPPLEGCYPKCPVDQPYFDEDTMKCVKKESCGCYYKAKHYNNGDKVPSTKNCQKCASEIHCETDDSACTCQYKGTIYHYGDTVYNTTDGYGNCITAKCGKNGNLDRASYPCPTTLPPTTTVFDFSSTSGPTSTTCQQSCEWSKWFDTTFPTPGSSGELLQNVTCNNQGLLCENKYQTLICLDYEVKAECCERTECTQTTTTTTPTTTPTTTTTTMTPTTTSPLTPKRTNGKCSNITCNNGIIIHEHMKCEDAPLPVCVNNHLPKKVTDESGCCSKYECQCICSGFGDPHYITFDGTYYPFQGNCSYVLVKEIHPKYNFSVIIDNVYCASEDGLSCPKSLTVHYKSFEIFMTQEISKGIVTNVIIVNNKRVTLPYENEDFRITDNGIESLVVIPAIDAQVTFTGMMFFINLPWQKFHGNTEGQCALESMLWEGCYCPEGMIQLSPDLNLCVNSCENKKLTYTSMISFKVNETEVFDCTSCTCEAPSLTVNCMPLPCPTPTTVNCNEPGQKRITQIVDCCKNDSCVCDVSTCPNEPKACQLGFIPKVETKVCCPVYTCVPEPVCVFNDTVYKPGVAVPKEKCETCVCTDEVDPQTNLHKISCSPLPCQKQCPLGYKYKSVPGKCCGECVRTSCVVMINNVPTTILINQTLSPPGDKCVKYTCQDVNGEPMTKESRKMCPDFNPDICVPGTETSDADGCCMSCTPKSDCNIQKNTTVLTHDKCISTTPVEITSCGGFCGTSS